MAVSARDFLSQPPARGRGAECAPARAAAFAAALAVHRKLSGLTVQQCFELFLEARGRAADALLLPDMGSAGTDAGAATGAAANASVHSLAMLVAVVRDTLLDASIHIPLLLAPSRRVSCLVWPVVEFWCLLLLLTVRVLGLGEERVV